MQIDLALLTRAAQVSLSLNSPVQIVPFLMPLGSDMAASSWTSPILLHSGCLSLWFYWLTHRYIYFQAVNPLTGLVVYDSTITYISTQLLELNHFLLYNTLTLKSFFMHFVWAPMSPTTVADIIYQCFLAAASVSVRLLKVGRCLNLVYSHSELS